MAKEDFCSPLALRVRESSASSFKCIHICAAGSGFGSAAAGRRMDGAAAAGRLQTSMKKEYGIQIYWRGIPYLTSLQNVTIKITSQQANHPSQKSSEIFGRLRRGEVWRQRG